MRSLGQYPTEAELADTRHFDLEKSCLKKDITGVRYHFTTPCHLTPPQNSLIWNKGGGKMATVGKIRPKAEKFCGFGVQNHLDNVTEML